MPPKIAKLDIRLFDTESLIDKIAEIGMPAFRAKQIDHWIWKKSVRHFDAMTNLPQALIEYLKTHFSLNPVCIAQEQISKDGTIKTAFKLHDGKICEGVLIPTEKRLTACISSQIGCSLTCAFCATGKLKRLRNIEYPEIYDQVVAIDNESRLYFDRKLSNIVFMGMGEPLMNYNNVLKAIDKITSPEGLGMSPRRITVSTSGVPKMIKKMADDEVKFKLAVSLHSAINETRTSIMPFNATFPLESLREALEYWYTKTKSRITYEYVVWEGINDAQKDANALVEFCKFSPSKVNLIEYNPIDDGEFQQASNTAIDMYVNTLERNGITVTVRRSRGKDIDAACGQLANKS